MTTALIILAAYLTICAAVPLTVWVIASANDFDTHVDDALRIIRADNDIALWETEMRR